MLNSFKEILIRKTSDDKLKTLIKFMDPEILADKTMESLCKMAEGKKGMLVNNAVRDFGKEMDPEIEPHMMRDAIGHHVSRYKAALQSGNQRLANRHANQAFKVMNLANISEPHSSGKMNIDFVDPKPWERQKYTDKYTDASHPKVQEGKVKVGDFITATKGLNYSKSGSPDKDYSFLQKQPHESYSRDVTKHGHNKAYPFERVSINGKHITVEDLDPSKVTQYESHEFDKHPIMEHFEEPTSRRNANSDAKYHADKDKYYGDMEHISKFFDRHQKMQESDPKGYEQRGMNPSSPVHRDIEGLDVSKKSIPSQPQQVSAPQAQTAQPSTGKKDMSKVPFDIIEGALGKDAIVNMLNHESVDKSTIPDHIKRKYGV